MKIYPIPYARLALRVVVTLACLSTGATLVHTKTKTDFRFAILGDRTGEAVAGVYEQAWKELASDHPAFVIDVGDTIQGGDDFTMDSEWLRIEQLLNPYKKLRHYSVPGNHDVWSLASALAFEKYTGHPLHYGFDFGQAHFTVLDNSRTETLPAEEIAFLRNDLQAHAKQPLKFIFFHRPSWILTVLLRNPQFPLHQLAKQYGVQYVICGHIHEMLRFELDGVNYLSIASSGGHLRDPKTYEKGWFFQHTLVTVSGDQARLQIQELGPPFGKGRVTKPEDWGSTGLAK